MILSGYFTENVFLLYSRRKMTSIRIVAVGLMILVWTFRQGHIARNEIMSGGYCRH
jgi:hypothetical protein